MVRHWLFWGIVAISLLHFLIMFALIYIKSEFDTDSYARPFAYVLDRIQLTGTGPSYKYFLDRQAANATILLVHAAATLIAGDFVAGGMNFYLSKPIGRIHYLAGKTLALAGMVALVTWVPAIGLFVAYALYSSSFEYAQEHTNILIAITGYSLLLMLIPTLLALAIASTLRKTAAIVVAFVGILLVLPAFGRVLQLITDWRVWNLISIPRDMDIIADMLFGIIHEDRLGIVWQALTVVVGAGVVSIVVVLHRLRAVEVVR